MLFAYHTQIQMVAFSSDTENRNYFSIEQSKSYKHLSDNPALLHTSNHHPLCEIEMVRKNNVSCESD